MLMQQHLTQKTNKYRLFETYLNNCTNENVLLFLLNNDGIITGGNHCLEYENLKLLDIIHKKYWQTTLLALNYCSSQKKTSNCYFVFNNCTIAQKLAIVDTQHYIKIIPILEDDENIGFAVFCRQVVASIRAEGIKQQCQSLQHFINYLPDHILILDTKGNVIAITEAFGRQYSNALAGTEPLSLRSIINADSLNKFDQLMNLVVDQAISPISERLVCSIEAGISFEVELLVNRTFLQDAEVLICALAKLDTAIVLGNTVDLSGKQIVEQTSDMFALYFWYGSNGELLWFNQEVEIITGFTTYEIMHWYCYPHKILSTDSRNSLSELLLNPDNLKISNITVTLLTADRLQLPASCEIQNVFSSTNECLGLLFIFTGHLPKIDNKISFLSESNAFSSFLVDKTDYCLLEINRFLNITYANEQAIELFGIDKGSKKTNITNQIPGLIHLSDWKRFKGQPQNNRFSYAISRTINLKHQPIDVSIHFFDIKGNTAIAIENITRKNRKNDILLKAKKISSENENAKDLFLSLISHEMRTPLNVIIGIAALLQHTKLDTEQQKYLHMIGESSETLLEIVDNVLDVSDIENGKLHLRSEAVVIPEIFQKLKNYFAPKAEKNRLNLVLQCDSCNGLILDTDEKRLYQILQSLVNNAFKFTKQGFIAINAMLITETAQTATIHFEVSDSGVGIPDDKLRAITKSFMQSNSGYSREFTGLGLGLTIAYHLIRLFRSKLHIESELNKGSRFHFQIKYSKMRNATNEKVPSTSSNVQISTPQSLNNIRIILAEDQEFNQKLIVKLCETWGCNIEVADNGAILLEMLEQNNYDLILMDIQMPVMDGIEAATHIRASSKPSISKIPIIALTAFTLQMSHEKCIAAGMNSYLSKPFRSDELFKAIWLNVNDKPATGITQPISKVKPIHRLPKTHPIKEQKLYNLKEIEVASAGNKAFVVKMIHVFLNKTPQAVAEMKLACTNCDYEELRKTAHRVKPSLSFMGIKSVENEMIKVESFAREKTNLEEIPTLLSLIDQNLTKVYKSLEAEVQNLI